MLLEKEYALCGSNKDGNKRVIFRDNTSTKELLDMHKNNIKTARLFERDDGCNGSCELFPT